MFSRGQEGFGKRKINMKALVYTDHETLSYRDELDAKAKDGVNAFRKIHDDDGATASPKIILLP